MKKTFTLLIALFALSLSAWAQTTVTWEATDVASLHVGVYYGYTPQSQTIDDITITAYAPTSGDYCHFLAPSDDGNSINIESNGKLTFAPKSGKLTRIVISLADDGIANPDSLPKNSGWSYNSFFKQLYWIGSAASTVALTGNGSEQGIYFSKIQSVDFTVVPATGTVVTWDADILDDVNLSKGDGIPGDNVSQTFQNITASVEALANGDVSDFYTPSDGTPWIHIVKGGKLTFAPTSGNLTNIVISCAALPTNPENLKAESGWTWDISTMRLTWSGDAASSVDLECDATSNGFYFNNITSVVYTVVSSSTPVTPATTTITWESTDCESVQISSTDGNEDPKTKTIKGITATAATYNFDDYSHFYKDDHYISISVRKGGTITFTSTVGDITRIVISCEGQHTNPNNVSTGWTWDYLADELVWTGEAASSVVLACNSSTGEFYFRNINSIDFTVLSDAAPDPTPSATTIEWDNAEVSTIALECTNVNDVQTTSAIDGITASLKRTSDGGNCEFKNSDLWISSDCGQITFTSTVGNISGIVITADERVYTSPYNLPTDWTWDDTKKTLTWAGTAAAAVTLSGSMDFIVSSIEFTVAEASPTPVDPDPTPAGTTITWDVNEVSTVSLECSSLYEVQTSSAIDGITASLKRTIDNSNKCQFKSTEIWIQNCGRVTFTSTVGDISGILITCDPLNEVWNHYNLSEGWTYNGDEAKTFTWTGTPSSQVTLSGNIDFMISSIEFTVVEASAGTTITWEEEDVVTVAVATTDGYEPEYQIVKGISVTTAAPKSGDKSSFTTYMGNTSISVENGGTLTFAPVSGQLTSIVISCELDPDNPENLPDEWTWDENTKKLTWTGEAASSVALACKGSTGSMYFRYIFSIAFTVVEASAPANPSFLWEERQVNLVNCNGEIDVQTTNVIKNIITSLVRTSSGHCRFQSGEIVMVNNGTLTFKSIVGDITKIVITCSGLSGATNLPDGWTYNEDANTLTWDGTAAEEVTLYGNISCPIASIEFFYNPTAAPRLGERFEDGRGQYYQITGAHTAKMPQQTIHGTLDIPDFVIDNGVSYYITEIADNAFYNNDDLSNVMGGKNIASIGAHAFEGCIHIYDALLETTVLESIGDEAFKNCKLMASFECFTWLPPVLGSNAFAGDNRINHIEVNTVDDYKAADGWSAFTDKISDIGVTPDQGEEFFYHNQTTVGLYAVTIGATLSTTGEAKVLPYNAELNAIFPITREGTLIIPEKATYIHRDYDITGIGANAYKDCTSIDRVLMPQAVTSIEAGAFLGCTGVVTVIFLWDDPTTVTWADGAAGQGKEFQTAASGKTTIIVPKGRKAEYQAWAPAWADCMTEGELQDVTAAAPDAEDTQHVGRYYRTFYDSSTDYMMPPSVWAHVGYISGNEFILRPIAFDGEILPRGTAVVLESETQSYRLIPTGNTAPIYTGDNDLSGTDTDLAVSSLGDDADNVYVLGRAATINGNRQVGMGLYRYTGTTLGEHKAYLIPKTPVGSGSSGSGAPARFVFRHEDTATSFENVQKDNELCTKILRDGQLIIIRDGKEYNAQGMIIK